MTWRVRAKRLVPAPLLNRVLLTFPSLYRTDVVAYESNLRGDGLEDLAEQLPTVLELDGNLAECGCSRCGTTVVMARMLADRGADKTIYAFDSFAGFEPDEIARERAAGLNTSRPDAFLSTSYEYVKAKVARLGLDDVIIPVQGYFQDTLAGVDSRWCLALIDCDLTDSLVYCAETIWPNLASGGLLLFDDYTAEAHRGARLGVDRFVAEHAGEIASHGMLRRLYRVEKA